VGELESKRAQVARVRRTAGCALAAYAIDEPRLTFSAHGENTTYRVDSPDGRYLLRVHRPNRHGPGVDSRQAVGSEFDWLAALQADTDLQVPTPIRTRTGDWTTTAVENALFTADAVHVLTHLDDFIAVAFGLWFAGMAQVNPAFAADLDKTMDYIRRSLDQLL
jgi:aminoglycoside phosphotransferase (APT) family kinase protein